MSIMRLDKFLTMTGQGTRSEVKKILKSGTITVNGQPVKKPEQKIDPDKDVIMAADRRLLYEPFICLMFHKPSGCITATSDRQQKTVMDYIDHERKDELFPVGRLDIDTEGLLLLMNDGDLAHRMLSPKHHVEKTYFVRVEGFVTDEDGLAFANGIDIGEKNLTICVEAAPRWLEDFGDDIRDDYRREARRTGREIRRENRRAAKEAREEQRNIARADGDSRFKDEYLTDDELTALRTLKSLPVGKKIFIECFKDQASDIKRMCNKLPEFSFVTYNKDEYKEYIGCTVIRRSYR